MSREVSEIKRALSVICAKEMQSRRMWTTGKSTSRTDGAMAPALTNESVDAVFEEGTVSFVSATAEASTPVAIEPASMVANLSTQLAALEEQCVNLRRLLDAAV